MSEWREGEIRDIGEIISGGTPSSTIEEYWNGDIVWITPFDLSKIKFSDLSTSSRKITAKGLENSSASLIPKQNIVISSRAPIGYCAVPSTAFTTNQGCKSIKLKNGHDPYFHYFNIQFNINKLKQKGEGTTFAEISKNELEKIKLRYPVELSHQRKIARILTTVDNIIEKAESTIEKYKAIKQGMMHDLFTRGIDVKTGKLRPSYGDAPELYKETELGMIPMGWEVKKLEEFVYMRSGDGITSESIEVMGDYPVYGGNGLRGYAKKFTHSGDFVLIGRQGALCGNVFRVNGKFFASEHAVVVTILDSSNVDWLAQKLKFMKLNKYSEASAQPGLAVTKLLSLSVALPKENEQKEVSKRFLILNSKLKIEQTALSKYQKLKQGLMQDLLTGKNEVTPDLEDYETTNNE